MVGPTGLRQHSYWIKPITGELRALLAFKQSCDGFLTLLTSCEAAVRLGHMRASSASEAWYVCLTTRYGGDRLSTVQTTWIKPVPRGRCTMPTLNQSYDAPMTNITLYGIERVGGDGHVGSIALRRLIAMLL